MKKVLMIYPEIPATYWSFRHSLPFIKKKALMPPLGLMTVAALLPKDYDISIIDMNVNPLDDQDILTADIVFVSAMIVQKESFARVVARCNRLGIPVAAGGPYPTSSYRNIRGIDYFILDEGEVTVPQFIRDLERGAARHIYRAEEKPDITYAPIPRFDLIDTGDYANMALQFSRGCPFQCEFCDIIEMFGRIPRVKAVSQFIEELDAVHGTGYTGPLFIVDDNFIGNKHEAVSLLRALVSWQKVHEFPFNFFTEASINLAAEDELLSLMVESGFNMVFVGIETPDELTLSSIQKGQNVRHNLLESVKKIQSYGIEVTGGFIVGFDADTEDIFDRQIEFIQKSGISIAMAGLLIALPGTQLYRRLEKEGRLEGESSGNNTNRLELNFIPVMDRKKLFEGYLCVIRKIFSPGEYFVRSLTFFSRIPLTRPAGRKLAPYDLAALARSLIRQSFSSYGFYYLLFLFRALFTNPRNFSLAVNIAIKGHHLFTITHLTLKTNELGFYAGSLIERFEREIRKRIDEGNLTPSNVQAYAESTKKKIMKKYRHLGRTVRKFSYAEYESFIARIDEIADSFTAENLEFQM
jgi:radical SAM superfamily enzyme YgiQ (UPF0313 family)